MNTILEGPKLVRPCQLPTFPQWNQTTVTTRNRKFASSHIRGRTLRPTKAPPRTKSVNSHESQVVGRPPSVQKPARPTNLDSATVKNPKPIDPSIAETATPSSSQALSPLSESAHAASSNLSKATPLSPTALNAFAVSQLSARAHPTRPASYINDGRLPDKYKPAARRITRLMVALPILIVTSYMLYDRLVLGKERKRFVREPPEGRGAEGLGQEALRDADVVGKR